MTYYTEDMPADHTRLLDRIREQLANRPSRVCVLCTGDLSAPGTAMPILDPDCREGPPEANWRCLDEHGCDVRAAQRHQAAALGLPPGYAWLFWQMATIVRPVPLELEAPR